MQIKMNEVPPSGVYGLDTETDKLEWEIEGQPRKLVLLQLYSEEKDTAWLIQDHSVISKIDFSSISVYGHNLVFDLSNLLRWIPGFKFPKILFDSFLFGLMNQEQDKGLKEMVFKYLGIRMLHFEEVGAFTEVLSEKQIKYAADDSKYTVNLCKKLEVMFPQHSNIMKLECNLLPHLVRMTVEGLLFNTQGVDKMEGDIAPRIMDAQAKLNQMAGREILVGSPKKVAEWVFGDLGFSPIIKTEKGAPSTSEEALAYFDSPELRQLKAVKSLYSVQKAFKTYRNMLSSDSRVHPVFQSIGWDEASSRIYTNPSVQSLPMDFRFHIVPNKGNKFIYTDLSAAELYLCASLSGETDLVERYHRGEDLHTYVSGRLITGLQMEVPEGFSNRDISKIVTFSVIFGSEGAAASRALRIPEKEASNLVSYFFRIFKNIDKHRKEVIDEFRSTGIAKTPIGRIRIIKERNAHADRQAFNTYIQSGLADYMKYYMIKIDEALEPFGGKVRITVFDSFLIEVPESLEKDKVNEIISPILKGLKLKFNFKLKEGYSWGEVSQ